MSKHQDLTGNKYGRLTVIEQAPSFITPKGKKQIAWKVLCDCGTEKIVRGCDLKSGSIVSCGCYNKEKDIGKKKFKDLSGQKFGRLTVESYAYTKNKKAYWNCVCDCGNHGVYMGHYLCCGDTKSCGCQKYESAGSYQAIDLTGRRFGRLVAKSVISRSPRKWRCVCDCGSEVDVLTNLLLGGHTKSCGCYHIDRVIETSVKDISGQRFGKLVAEELAFVEDGKYIWKCRCDCGSEILVYGASLRSGNTKSCGCLLSGTEIIISDFLKRNNIQFDQQKTFLKCVDNGYLRFDFYLPSYNIAIEYDGELHYMETSLGNDLEGQQRRDAIKTKYCEENDIILLRIPYWEKDNIESILTDWLFLKDGEEANSSAVDLSA